MTKSPEDIKAAMIAGLREKTGKSGRRLKILRRVAETSGTSGG